jgi:hypothetical protein
LVDDWFQTDITITLGPEAGPALADDPGVTDRIRGALGRALMEGASAASISAELCSWTPPCTHDVLWNPKGSLRRGVEIPKPFRLAVGVTAERAFCVTLSLFGLASEWAEPAAEALVRAFRNGVALEQGCRRGWSVVDRAIATPPPFPGCPFGHDSAEEVGVVLAFQTPFAFRGRDRSPLDPLALLTGLSRRAEGMARWHHGHLQVQGQDLADAAACLRADVAHLQPYHRLRPANRGRAEGIPLDGYRGPYALSGPAEMMARVWPLLALGTAVGAGTRASLGFGGYRLSLLGGAGVEGRSVENL